jgi:hypothetical protein
MEDDIIASDFAQSATKRASSSRRIEKNKNASG